MAIIVGKLIKKCFESGNFHLFRARATGGKYFNVIYRGPEPPKARKTVQVVMYGEWVEHERYGKQLELERIERYVAKPSHEEQEREAWRKVSRIVGTA